MSGATYPCRSTLTLTAIPPDASYGVREWTGAAASCGRASTCQITMDGNKTVGVD